MPYQNSTVFQGSREEVPQAGHLRAPGGHRGSVMSVWMFTHQGGGVQMPRPHSNGHGRRLAGGIGLPEEV